MPSAARKKKGTVDAMPTGAALGVHPIARRTDGGSAAGVDVADDIPAIVRLEFVSPRFHGLPGDPHRRDAVHEGRRHVVPRLSIAERQGPRRHPDRLWTVTRSGRAVTRVFVFNVTPTSEL